MMRAVTEIVSDWLFLLTAGFNVTGLFDIGVRVEVGDSLEEDALAA